MKIHHIGYLVKDINESITKFEVLGYKKESDIIPDPFRKINICFMINGDYRIELVSPYDESSVVYNTLKKIGNSPYHICYNVDSISNAIVELKEQGFRPIGNTEVACAIDNHDVVFLFNNKIGIIELVEGV